MDNEELTKLKALLKKYERALEEEIWSPKLGKFIPFRENPSVKKILEEPLELPEEEKNK